MVKPVLPYGRQSIDDEDVAAVVEALKGDWLTQGPTVARFEAAICAATGAKYAVAVANGTAALHLACLAAGMRAGDVGFTSDVTFVASANAMRYVGGRPVLCDVDPRTGLISTSDLESKVTAARDRGERVRVLTPVDLTGSVADLAAVRTIADRVGAVVIEDAAHSLGASYENGGTTYRAAGGHHAHMAILSFHPVKHVTTGEGGAITTNDEALFRELCDLRSHGITRDPARLGRNDGPWYYEQHTLGFNYRITDIQCALGATQIAKLPRFVERRRAIAHRYDAAFAALEKSVRPLAVPPNVTSSYHLYVIQLQRAPGEDLESVAARRKAAYLHLRELGIAPQVHYIPVHRQPDFIAAGLAGGSFPGADEYYAGCLSLPMYPALTDDDVDRVVDSVRLAVES